MAAEGRTLRPGGIVAGFDGSEEALRAVRWAGTEARQRARSLVIVRAVDRAPSTVSVGTRSLGRSATGPVLDRRRVDEQLAELAEELRTSESGPLEFVHREGYAPVTLADVGEQADAEMIVIGSTGLAALPRLVLGSTAAELIRIVRRPVVVVRGDSARKAESQDERRPVVVGVDDSTSGQAAIEFAFDFASRHDCQLLAVRAEPGGRYPFDETQLDAAEVLERQLGDWPSLYPDVPVEKEYVADSPAHALLERAGRARLLVVGARGRNVLSRTLLGSVSHAALFHSSCPVAVLRSSRLPSLRRPTAGRDE